MAGGSLPRRRTRIRGGTTVRLMAYVRQPLRGIRFCATGFTNTGIMLAMAAVLLGVLIQHGCSGTLGKDTVAASSLATMVSAYSPDAKIGTRDPVSCCLRTGSRKMPFRPLPEPSRSPTWGSWICRQNPIAILGECSRSWEPFWWSPWLGRPYCLGYVA